MWVQPPLIWFELPTIPLEHMPAAGHAAACALAASFLIMGYALSPLLQAIFPANAHINGASVVGAAATFGESGTGLS
jgi:hypothetical protein